jgi:hypothetical protein
MSGTRPRISEEAAAAIAATVEFLSSAFRVDLQKCRQHKSATADDAIIWMRDVVVDGMTEANRRYRERLYEGA